MANRETGTSAKSAINAAARSLFAEQGYDKTRMRDIAERAGVEKTLVQYHFPHKDVFIASLVKEILDDTNAYIKEQGWQKEGYFENLLMVGAAHFAYILQSPNMKNLTVDMIANRSVTEDIINLDIQWATDYMGFVPRGKEAEWADYIALIMGGAYELIYRRLIDGRSVSPEALIKRCIRLEMLDQGYSKSDIDKTLATYQLTDDQLTQMVEYLDGKLF